ncbi:hypothetical protein EYZ11_002270 [Aspergillus tanneri]|uniref:Zn(2)-C6 fungal-type domain-containing protein n=1 Tax=Aspergillus tanneri TaxID=1220188 RepID=A0A4S3JT67_9EURO|nr:hypothetical protein EYZ11_002270 [Aspergillus tanneri]
MPPANDDQKSELTSQARPIARRKRRPLSCTLCRRRKLACDREYPSCSRCQKCGKGDSCSYEERPASPNINKPEPDVSGQTRFVLDPTPLFGNTPTLSAPVGGTTDTDHYNNRPIVVAPTQNVGTWQLLGNSASWATADGQLPAIKADVAELAHPCEPNPTEAVIFRGENYKTQYYGSTNSTSLIAHFPELRSYMKETIKHHPALPGVQKELKSLDVKWKHEKPNTLPVKEEDLLLLLPDREDMDAAIRLYFDTFETMYRILHRPTFLEEYHQLQSNQGAAKPGFIVLILLARVVSVENAEHYGLKPQRRG